MDEKHRQYCIKLGNPYMEGPKYNKFIEGQEEQPWISVSDNMPSDWEKNNNKKVW